jgi:hypothetical protein
VYDGGGRVQGTAHARAAYEAAAQMTFTRRNHSSSVGAEIVRGGHRPTWVDISSRQIAPARAHVPAPTTIPYTWIRARESGR